MTLAILEDLKTNNEDFEWYPTTSEIIKCIVEDYHENHSITSSSSILDIGAGDGRVLKEFQNLGFDNCYAIEKSPILINQLVKHALVIGTNFHEQTLLDKNMDIIFCNPPYSEYETWMHRIIAECGSTLLYFVVPERWQDNNNNIQQIIKERKGEVTILGNYDFLNADRQARAKVHVLKIKCKTDSNDLFDKFFDKTFGELTEVFYHNDIKNDKESENNVETVEEGIPRLVQLYNHEFERIKNNYNKIATLDMSVLTELNCTINSIKTLLRNKIIKNNDVYWGKIINNMTKVTERLNSKNRNAILERIKKNANIDFTIENIYSILTWVLENANNYVDSQIIDIFERLSYSDNIIKYKSNDKVFNKNQFRYYRGESDMGAFKLDYRLVIPGAGLDSSALSWGSERLSNYGRNILMDLFVVARSFGYVMDLGDDRLGYGGSWEGRKSEEFFAHDGTLIVEAKPFKNGNMHIRLGQRFALLLNIAIGKLKGWIHNPQQAADDLQEPEAAEAYTYSHKMGKQLLIA
jgi:hypothetical protein